MRFVRVLAHLLLALAFLSGTAAQARSVACAAMSAPAPAHHGHELSDEAMHADHAAGRPLHERAICQALCCLVAATLPAPAPTARPAAYADLLRYASAADPTFGRAPAPEPGIPKRLS